MRRLSCNVKARISKDDTAENTEFIEYVLANSSLFNFRDSSHLSNRVVEYNNACFLSYDFHNGFVFGPRKCIKAGGHRVDGIAKRCNVFVSLIYCRSHI